MIYGPRTAQGLALAFELHRQQERKGAGAPYITHLLAVAALVGEYGGDEDQFIAALLHDAVEDQGGLPTLKRVQDMFGDRVASLVLACSDTDVEPKPPWRERKELFVRGLAAAHPDIKLIVAADKLHNARITTRDLRTRGHDLWRDFKGGADGTLWYYDEVLLALQFEWQHAIIDELADAVESLQKAAQGIPPAPEFPPPKIDV